MGRRSRRKRARKSFLARRVLAKPPPLPPFSNRSTALVERVPTERVKEGGGGGGWDSLNL